MMISTLFSQSILPGDPRAQDRRAMIAKRQIRWSLYTLLILTQTIDSLRGYSHGSEASLLRFLASITVLLSLLSYSKQHLSNPRQFFLVLLIVGTLILSNVKSGVPVNVWNLFFIGWVFVLHAGALSAAAWIRAISKSSHWLSAFSLLFILFRINPTFREFVGVKYWLPLNPIFGLPDSRQIGIWSSPNNLGVCSAISLVAALAERRTRLFAVVPMACLLLSGSRGSLYASLAGVAFLLARDRMLRSLTTVRRAWPAILPLPVLILPVAVFEQKINLTPSALTGRGAVWDTIIEVFKDSWLIGSGAQWYVPLIQNGLLQDFATSAHNSLLEALMATGIVGLFAHIALWKASLARLLHKTPAVGGLAVALAINSLVESVASIENLRSLSITTFLLLALALVPPQESPEQTDRSQGNLHGTQVSSKNRFFGAHRGAASEASRQPAQ